MKVKMVIFIEHKQVPITNFIYNFFPVELCKKIKKKLSKRSNYILSLTSDRITVDVPADFRMFL